MLEFALITPVFLLVFLGLVVTGVVVMNQVQLNNAMRDAARAAAVCGGATARSQENPAPVLPDGTSCTEDNLKHFAESRLNGIGTIAAPNVCLSSESSSSSCVDNPDALDGCSAGKTITVAVSYQQPLYIPFVGYVLGDGGSNTRTIQAVAQAVCEQ